MVSFRLLVLIVWVWVHVTQGIEETYIVDISSVLCVPEVGIVTGPAKSLVICAMMCHRFRGLAFMFSGEVCDIRGAGIGESSSSSVFRKFPPVPLLQLHDISRGKPTEAPHYYGSWRAYHAVDGDIKTMYHSATNRSRPWWVLDMEGFNLVFAVDILTRQDTWGFRFHDIEIRVGGTPRVGEDFSSWALLGAYKGPYTLAEGRLNFTSDAGLCGRYVVIHKISADTDHLQLVDVKIYVRKL